MKQPFTILAVDDHLVNLKLIEKSLSKEGYRVLTASNGPHGRQLALAELPDLILLDIQMPGEDGFEVIQFLKNNPLTASIPVIFLTGVSEVHSKLKGFDLGAVDYITKPFHNLEVIARVRIHLKLSIATNSLIAEQAHKLRQLSEAQESMLPLPQDNPDAKFGVYYKALHEAGGDFYDILDISDQIKGYFVADFSGHDIKTSYMTASVKALLVQNCTPVYSPAESMKMINDVLVEILPEGKYLTSCYVLLNRETLKMTVINAGHPPVIHLPINGEPALLSADGDVLGMFKDAQFGITRIDVSPGDRFFIYSDGLVESAENNITWVNGAERFLSDFTKISNISVEESPRRLIDNIFGRRTIHQKGTYTDNELDGLSERLIMPEDDIVLLCVEV
ncbi:MAG: SpoIIE family protein phosphatase [Desulfamplus sp.]|nr:SpoIIE family protein phosphatase [Desulfamplus sp.]MBF0413022.1 SpoIIE family protein phosphatase [Desulfamplus sp.]